MRTHDEKLRRLGNAARQSAKLAEEDRHARDTAIEEAEQDGMRVREISRRVGLSVATVHGVLVVRAAARQEQIRRAAGLQ